MPIARSKGALTGLVLAILGAWGALVPFVGPYFDLVIGSDETWDWTAGRLWLFVLPGAVVFVGGLLLMLAARRTTAAAGGWIALAGGVWFIVGPTVSMLWNDGQSAAGAPAGSNEQQVLELLAMVYALGAAITALAAFGLGRIAVTSVRDAELAREREQEHMRDTELARDREPALERQPADARAPLHEGRPADRPEPGYEREGAFVREPADEREARREPPPTAPARAATGAEPTGVGRTDALEPDRPATTGAAPTAEPGTATGSQVRARRDPGLLERWRRSRARRR